MSVNKVGGCPMSNGPWVNLGEWLMVELMPLGDGIAQDPPEIKSFTVSADRNGVTIMYDLEGISNSWHVSFADNTPTFKRLR